MNGVIYEHNKIEVPRVSRICSLLSKPFLYRWNNEQGLKGINTKDYVNYTAQIGTSVHEAVEHHMMFNSEDKINEVLKQFNDDTQAEILYGFNKYLDTNIYEQIEEVKCECALTCGRFGGTIDVYCKHNDDYTLLDIKTSNAVSLSHKIQLSAYMELLEVNGIECNKYGILLIPVRSEKKAKFYEYSKKEMMFYRDMFLSLLSVYETQEKLKKWKKNVKERNNWT